MWPQLGGHLVVRSHPKPLGQDHQPAGAELDGFADARGAADGTQRIKDAIAPLVVSTPLCLYGSKMQFLQKIDGLSYTKPVTFDTMCI